MKLLLARHGLTDWNAANRFQGQTDLPLNHTGVEQARALARRLAREEIGSIYSSDLQRAAETARAIVGYQKCSILFDPRLRELHFGAWEGMTYDEIRQNGPARAKEWEASPGEVKPPGGETFTQLIERVRPFLQEILEKHGQQTILLVAHGGPLQVLVCLALRLSADRYWQFHIAPGSLSELGFYPAGAMLNSLNDISHLERIAL